MKTINSGVLDPVRWGLPLGAVDCLAERLYDTWYRFRPCFRSRTRDIGEIVELLHHLAQAPPVKQAQRELHRRLRHSSIVHGDETVWREEGQQWSEAQSYVWCRSTPEGERYYEYDNSRAGAVAKRILGSDFRGTLVSDFYGGYNDFAGEHQCC